MAKPNPPQKPEEPDDKAGRARAPLTALVLALAAASFMLGISLPIVRLNRFFFFTDEHSILSIIRGLFVEGELLLGLVILLFSVALPALKIMVSSWLLTCGQNQARTPFFGKLGGALGKWSMVDVLLVALVIFAVKTSGLGTATSQPGLYFFAASVAMTAIAAAMVRRLRP